MSRRLVRHIEEDRERGSEDSSNHDDWQVLVRELGSTAGSGKERTVENVPAVLDVAAPAETDQANDNVDEEQDGKSNVDVV